MPQQDTFQLLDVFKREWFYSFLGALGLLGGAYVAEHFANVYAFEYLTRPTSVYVGDLFLDNFPIVDLSLIIVEGALFSIVVGTLFVVFLKPRYLLFTLKAVALFIIVRALFVSLTHVGIYPGSIEMGFGFFDAIYSYLNFQTGFFFSGHTGLPVLMAFIFWEKRSLRFIFIALSCIFAVAVLLAHIHYSIDVLAAPFMAYGIFTLAQHFFPRDYKLVKSAP